MAEISNVNQGLVAFPGDPLIGIPVIEHGQQVVHYFTSEVEADAFAASRRNGRDLAGIWADMDWEETEAALDRIRHSVPPTPPIDFPDL